MKTLAVYLVLDVANMEIVEITEVNFNVVSAIYLEGIATGLATFETKAPEWQQWDKSHLPFGRIAALTNNQMLGWAAMSPVSDRCVYGGVAEVSVYVSEKSRGTGVGKNLLNQLIAISEGNGIWTLQSGVFKENKASIALHEKCGFRVIGYKEKIGQLNGIWLDNVLLERRSTIIGI
jgi:L-amino acid N-acyltransferase YncA